MPTLEVIEDFSRLESIAPAWSVLAEEIPSTTPFQLPAWQLTGWRYFGSGQLRVLTWWKDELLVGLIPCFLHMWQGRRQLTLIGSGISDYLEPLLHQEHAPQILRQVCTYLQSNTDWNLCNWQDLAFDTPLHLLGGSLGEDTVCSEVLLRGTFEEFWQSRPKDLRRNLRRYSERAASQAPVTFHVNSDANNELLQSLIHLHAARWEKRGESGAIAENNSADFLLDIARQFASRNMLRIFTVCFGGNVAALVLTFLYRNTIYSYMSAFDPMHEILGFGRTLLHESFRYAFGNQYRAWNFCRGDEHYKFSWGARPIEKRRLELTRGTVAGNPQPSGG
jgi:CelD/BcsL family acetyltransferase involved in cellulose biosynthesis